MKAREFIFEAQVRVDVPNENWLEDKITYAEKKGRDRFGAPYFGATTAYIPNGENVIVPVNLLAKLPGMRKEQQNVRQKDLDAIMQIMKDTGKLPLLAVFYMHFV